MSRLLILGFSGDEVAQLSGFAQSLGLPFDALALTGSAAPDSGAEKTFAANWSEIPPADACAKAIAEFSAPYSHVAAISNMRSKDVLSRVAGLRDAAMISDAIGAESAQIFHRPIMAGSMTERVEALSNPVVLTVRPASFPKGESRGASATESVKLNAMGRTDRKAVVARSGGRPDLTQAKIVVSGGRPLKDAATFESVIGGLADALGGAAGATRAAVDSGIAANELQVGQTGKIVAPELYIAAGISGSTQHMAGIKDSKIIVAINKDPDAPIFEFADFGLVADLFDAIPALRAKIGK